ncbi:hypothetical protein F511_34966 [Dorcoceras hygrometricum]|uniref:Uncharacterized protein n=1 Tax=Dorcoceras hygrometricum TaxID=472368 RepID=A0A2Z7ABV1_9LAMI|nr:hypothetical protein F511_34966 [Dorcoceras hygrometricum]
MHRRGTPATFHSISLLRPPMAGSPPVGPPPGSAGPNLIGLGPDHGRTRVHDSWERDAPRSASAHSARCSSTNHRFDLIPYFEPLLATPKTTMNPPKVEP